MSDNSYKPDRPVFCGNFEYDAREKEIVRMFEKYGEVDHVDMKTGFAFVYMLDKRDAEEAIRKLDNMEFGYKRRRLRVEWAQQKEADRKRETKPCSTIFVVNFDVTRARERDLERFFDYYGKILRLEIKKNYAFVQYSSVEEAQRALERTNGTEFMGRRITVEYVANEDPYAPGGVRESERSRPRSRSPSYERPRRRSPSPARRRSPSPARRRSPSPVRRRSPSPVRRRSPSPIRRRSPSPRQRSPSYSR